MEICYWNVCNKTPWEEIAAAGTIMQIQGVDTFCLQEVPFDINAKQQPVDLIANELHAEQFFVPTRSLTRTKGYGTTILTTAGLMNPECTRLRNDRFAYMTPGKSNQRVLLSAQTESRAETRINVAHLSYSLPFGLGRNGIYQERMLLINALRSQREESEVVLGGDANCQPEGELHAALHAIGLTALIPSHEITFRSKHWYAGYAERNLDMAYASTEASARIGDYGPSDHRPTIVTI